MRLLSGEFDESCPATQSVMVFAPPIPSFPISSRTENPIKNVLFDIEHTGGTSSEQALTNIALWNISDDPGQERIFRTLVNPPHAPVPLVVELNYLSLKSLQSAPKWEEVLQHLSRWFYQFWQPNTVFRLISHGAATDASVLRPHLAPILRDGSLTIQFADSISVLKNLYNTQPEEKQQKWPKTPTNRTSFALGVVAQHLKEDDNRAQTHLAYDDTLTLARVLCNLICPDPSALAAPQPLNIAQIKQVDSFLKSFPKLKMVA